MLRALLLLPEAKWGRWIYDWSQDLSAKGVAGLPVSRNVTRTVGTG